MEFPDFLKFKPFNYLRHKMGATALGQFEFFEPDIHLSAEERQQLVKGMSLDVQTLQALDDNTLAFKNGRVLAFIDSPKDIQDWVYHLSACESFGQLSGKVRISMAKPHHSMGQYRVCADCLQVLRYKGFDAVRNRHRHYSQRVQEEFDLDEFFKEFPTYPLSAKPHEPSLFI